jgi:hypothetical protein
MRYFVGFLIAIGLFILLIVLLVHGGKKPAQVPTTKKTLTSYSTTDAVAKLTIDGPINSEATHQQIQISVGQDEVVYEQVRGYKHTVLKRLSYPNNESSFYNFLSALQHVGFTQGDKSRYVGNETAVCPLSQRYSFDLEQNDQKLQHYWATNCKSAYTYLGQVTPTLTLFEDQVPDYSKLPHVGSTNSKW